MKSIYLAPLLIAIPGTAFAQPLGFEEALARASASAPVIEARAQQIRARQSAAIAAGQLPDPKLGIGIDNFPVSGPPAFSFTEENMTMERIGIEQEVPNLAKRHAQRNRAQADVEAAEAKRAADVRRVRVATALAWIDALYAQRRLEAMDAILEKLRRLPRAATTAVAAGSARPAQSLGIRQAIAGLEDRRSRIVGEMSTARAELSRWTGEPDPHPAGALPHFDVSRSTLRTAIGQHPELEMASANLGQAMADVDTARAEKRPDWGFNVAFQRRDPRFGNMVSVGATMSLPIFPGRRQSPQIEAAASDAAAARAEQEDMRRTLEAQLEAGLADHVMHHEQWLRARDTLLPLARQKADLETASYAAGRAGLLDVIEAQAMLADSELETLDREAMVARDAARLVLTYESDSQ